MTASPAQPESAPQVREIHIDFLLEEEFCSNLVFLRKFITAAGRSDAAETAEVVKRSVGDAFGEADLLVVYRTATGDRMAVLIEDKLRAGFQPLQANRYRERGEAGIGREWQGYWTCLVAPKAYIERGHNFDAGIALEDVAGMFSDLEEKRRTFKSQILLEAVRKCEATGVQVVDAVMTEFRSKHYAYFHDSFAEDLRVARIDDIRRPAQTYKGDAWFAFRSRLHLPVGAYINHKAPMGVVDLTFPNTAVDAL